MAQTKVKLISDGVIVQSNLHASHGITTAHIGEGSNLYYTDARVGSYLSTNSFATESYVGTQITNLVDSSPATLNTLNELAAALGDDPNFATTTATSIGLKAPLASPSFTGNATFAGNVGVGLTADSNIALFIKANGNTYSTGNIVLEDADSTTKSAITHVNGGLYLSHDASTDDLALTSGNATFAGEISSGDDINVNNGKLVVNHTSAEVRIKSSSDTGESYINFSDPSDINPGQIYYGHSNNTMVFRVNDIGQMSLSNNLLVFPSTGVHEIRGDRGSGAFAIGNMGDASSQMMVSSRGFLTFNVSNTGSALNATERMRIDSSGDISFGGNSHTPYIQLVNSGRTAGNPGFSFNNDTNTGMFQPAGVADTIAFSTGGAERMRIFSNSNVNIGVAEAGSSAVTGPFVVTHGSSRFLTGSFEEGIVSLNAKNNSNTLESLRLAGDNVQFWTGSGTSGSIKAKIIGTGEFLIGTTTSVADVKLRVVQTENQWVQQIVSTGGAYGLSIDTSASSHGAAGSLQIYTNTGVGFKVQNDGKVGIGVTSPNAKLEIATLRQPGIRLSSLDTTAATNELLSGIEFYTADISAPRVSSYINCNFASAYGDSYLTFATSTGVGAATEKMRIRNDGIILISRTNLDISTQTGYRLDPNGEAYASIDGTAGTNAWHVYDMNSNNYRFFVSGAGQIHATSTSISAISDVTLKENIKPLETGLSEVMKLQPRRFDWKNGDGKNIAGFVAQEVADVLPDLVDDYKYNDEETKKSLKMGDMIPTLVKAIQELKAEIETLKTQING